VSLRSGRDVDDRGSQCILLPACEPFLYQNWPWCLALCAVIQGFEARVTTVRSAKEKKQ
jgi:hypothetical protein